MAPRVIALSCLVFLLSLISFATVATSEQCGYEVNVKTGGDTYKAGTDSNVSLTLVSCTGKNFTIPNLRDWGSQGPEYDYFKQGRLSHFHGSNYCLDVCAMIITSKDAMKTAPKSSGWYVEYVQVTPTDSNQTMSFPVYRWLANDVSPYDPSAKVNLCDCRFNFNSTPSPECPASADIL